MTAGVNTCGDPMVGTALPLTASFSIGTAILRKKFWQFIHLGDFCLISHSSLDNQRTVCLSVPIRHFICLPLLHSDHRALPEVLPVFHFSVPSFLLITLGDREAPCKVNFLQSFQSKGNAQARHHHPSPPLSKSYTPPQSLSHWAVPAT